MLDTVEASQEVPYNAVVVQIVTEMVDGFDGHQSSGFTAEDDSPCYAFRSNFQKRLLPQYMEIFEQAGFPEKTVGIKEDATGFNEDEGYSFPASDHYGLFLLLGEIPDDVMEKFRTLNTAMYDADFDRIMGRQKNEKNS